MVKKGKKQIKQIILQIVKKNKQPLHPSKLFEKLRKREVKIAESTFYSYLNELKVNKLIEWKCYHRRSNGSCSYSLVFLPGDENIANEYYAKETGLVEKKRNMSKSIIRIDFSELIDKWLESLPAGSMHPQIGYFMLDTLHDCVREEWDGMLDPIFFKHFIENDPLFEYFKIKVGTFPIYTSSTTNPIDEAKSFNEKYWLFFDKRRELINEIESIIKTELKKELQSEKIDFFNISDEISFLSEALIEKLLPLMTLEDINLNKERISVLLKFKSYLEETNDEFNFYLNFTNLDDESQFNIGYPIHIKENDFDKNEFFSILSFKQFKGDYSDYTYSTEGRSNICIVSVRRNNYLRNNIWFILDEITIKLFWKICSSEKINRLNKEIEKLAYEIDESLDRLCTSLKIIQRIKQPWEIQIDKKT